MNNEKVLSNSELFNITGGNSFLDTEIKNDLIASLLGLEGSKPGINIDTHIYNHRIIGDTPCYGIVPKSSIM